MNDPVNHPAHYTSHPSGVECIQITRHYCFAIGNAIKYLWRAGLKQDADKSDRDKEIEDLKKAAWYINDRIKQLEGAPADEEPKDPRPYTDEERLEALKAKREELHQEMCSILDRNRTTNPSKLPKEEMLNYFDANSELRYVRDQMDAIYKNNP